VINARLTMIATKSQRNRRKVKKKYRQINDEINIHYIVTMYLLFDFSPEPCSRVKNDIYF